MTETMTVLRCDVGKRAAKLHRWKGEAWAKSEDYDCGYLFEWSEVVLEDIHDLSRELLRIEADPRAFVIRGMPITGIDERVRRIKKGDERSSPSFREVDRRWVMVDIDKGPIPPADVATGPSPEAVRWAINALLPAGFCDAACHYQWSNSAGVKPWSEGLRIHLWFWLDRPVCNRSLRSWAREQKGTGIDAGVFTAVQPHYTSAPLFKGAPDPLERRSGLLPGGVARIGAADVLVDGATWDARLEAEELARREAVAKRGPSSASGRGNAWAVAKLRGCCDEILQASEGERHDKINSCAFSVGRILAAGGLDFHEALDALQGAALQVLPKGRRGEALRVPREALEDGMADPRELPAPRERAPRSSAPVSSTTSGESSPATSAESPASASPAEETKRVLADWFSERTRRLTLSGRLVGADGTIGAEVVPGVFGAPQPDARVPVGHFVSPFATGWWAEGREGPKSGTIVPCPVVIAGRCIDVSTNEHLLLIAWRDPGGWHRRLIPREEAFSPRVQQLSKWGMPITADSSKGLSRYLVAFEAENYQTIPTLRTSRVFGWQGESGADGFLIGRTHVAPDGQARRVQPDKKGVWDSSAIAFRAMGGDEEALADGFGAVGGSWKDWREAVRMLAPYPRALLGLYASFASPLLEILGVPCFILDWCADPETGKSTAGAVAMSVWGAPEALKRSWDGAGPYMERTLPTLNSLPFWCDESQLAAKRGGQAGAGDVVSNAIYTFVQGREKGAATLVGTRVARTWKTVMLSTGEQPLVSFCRQAGTRSRVVEVIGPPFGGQTPALGVLAAHVHEAVKANHGHAGIKWARFLLENRARWEEWGELFREFRKDYGEGTKGARLSHTRAVLEVAYRLVEEALELGLPNPGDAVWSEATAHAVDAGGAEAALWDVIGWYSANRSSFFGHALADRTPPAGWMGACVTSKESGELVAIYPDRLDRYLNDRGYHQATSILAQWRQRGWTVCDRDQPNRSTKKVKVGGVAVRMVALKASLLDGKDPSLLVPKELVPCEQGTEEAHGFR